MVLLRKVTIEVKKVTSKENEDACDTLCWLGIEKDLTFS